MAKKKARKNNKESKSNAVIGLIFTIAIVAVLGGVYAYWLATRTQTTTNIITTMGCLSVVLESDTAAINIANAYPISNNTGMTTTPYTFTIENECTTDLSSDITLEILSPTTLDSQYVRSSLQQTGVTTENSKILGGVGGVPTTTTTITGAKASHILLADVILVEAEAKTFDLRLWLDSAAPYEFASDKRFEAKIVIVSAPVTP